MVKSKLRIYAEKAGYITTILIFLSLVMTGINKYFILPEIRNELQKISIELIEKDKVIELERFKVEQLGNRLESYASNQQIIIKELTRASVLLESLNEQVGRLRR